MVGVESSVLNGSVRVVDRLKETPLRLISILSALACLVGINSTWRVVRLDRSRWSVGRPRSRGPASALGASICTW